GIHQIEARLAGSDGRAGNRFNMKSLQDIAFSNRSWYALSMLPGLRAACADGDTVTVDGADADISRGCAVLSAWDGRAEVDSIGWPLFNEWRTRLA
ncbi:penicillin acylase family protein, partial [Acinetobacter baumannii]